MRGKQVLLANNQRRKVRVIYDEVIGLNDDVWLGPAAFIFRGEFEDRRSGIAGFEPGKIRFTSRPNRQIRLSAALARRRRDIMQIRSRDALNRFRRSTLAAANKKSATENKERFETDTM